MKRIAIYCDGTWNAPNIPEPTHVVEMFDATQSYDASGDAPGQVRAYFSGVGTEGSFATRVANAVHRYGGGAFGWGLNGKIKAAYTYLSEVYEPGDEIFIFGFSRGGYTARSLAGMIRKSGLLARPTRGQVNRAFLLYKQLGENNGPDTGHIRQARRDLSPQFATSAQDLAWRDDGSHLVKIRFLGVWDTVGAMGIPQVYLQNRPKLAAILNFRHQFHDMALSSLVYEARHAVALDERRGFYPPALWTNLNTLSTRAGQGPGEIRKDRRYQQVWVVGDHGTVGGSTSSRALSAATLDWVRAGAAAAGLTFRPDRALPATPPDPVADEPPVPDRGGGGPSGPSRWRDGPQHEYELSDGARLRLQQRPDYRPGSLRTLRPDLFT